jgi:hypothetical protein
MRDGLNNSDSDDLSPIRRGGIGSMLVLLSAMVSIVTGVLFPTTGMSRTVSISLAWWSIVRKSNQPTSQTFG